jgi:uncharacterized protein YndB with AHSA1/START domain
MADCATTLGNILRLELLSAIVTNMAETGSNAGSPINPGPPQERLSLARKGSDLAVYLGARAEILGETRIQAAPAVVFAFLVDAPLMMTWFARSVKAEARPGGIFRLADPNGHWVEGTYLKVTPHRRVAFTWGGIEGLKPGQSTVEFSLRPDRNGTLVRLRHFGLSEPALDGHCRGWRYSGLPRLKAAAEGAEPSGSCLGDAADSRERHSHPARFVW